MRINKWMVSAVGVVALLAGVMVAGGTPASASHTTTTTTTAVCAPSSIDYGESTTCTVKVEADQDNQDPEGNPSATVTIRLGAVDGAVLGSCELEGVSPPTTPRSAVCSASDIGGSLSPGVHTLYIVYPGASQGSHNFLASNGTTGLTVLGGTIELKKVWTDDDFDSTTLRIGTGTEGDDVDDIASQLVTDNGTTGVKTVAPGTYYVTETAIDGYSASLSCVDGESAAVAVSTGGAVQVNDGDEITCTFTNTRQVNGDPETDCRAAPAIANMYLNSGEGPTVTGRKRGEIISTIAKFTGKGNPDVAGFVAAADRCESAEVYSAYVDAVEGMVDTLAQ